MFCRKSRFNQNAPPLTSLKELDRFILKGWHHAALVWTAAGVEGRRSYPGSHARVAPNSVGVGSPTGSIPDVTFVFDHLGGRACPRQGAAPMYVVLDPAHDEGLAFKIDKDATDIRMTLLPQAPVAQKGTTVLG